MTRTPNNDAAMRALAETAASGGNTLRFRTSPSAGVRQYTTTGDADQVTLRMRADTCQGAPEARVTIDAFAPRPISVTSTGYTDYVLPLNNSNGGAAGTHSIKVEFLTTSAARAATATCIWTGSRVRPGDRPPGLQHPGRGPDRLPCAAGIRPGAGRAGQREPHPARPAPEESAHHRAGRRGGRRGCARSGLSG